MDRILRFIHIILFAFCLAFPWSAWAGPIHSGTKNVDAYGGFLSAVTAVGADNKALLLSRIHTIPSGVSCTISPNTALHFLPGSGVSLESGATLYVYGDIVAGPYQIFYGSGTSVFEGKAIRFYDGAWNGGATAYGMGKQPDPDYVLDVDGPLRAQSLEGDITITNKDLPNPITAPEIRTEQKITGKIFHINLSVTTTVTLSGASVYGPFITGASNEARPVESGISVELCSAVEGMSAVFYNGDDTSESGNTLFIIPPAGDTVISDTECIAGASKYILSGTTLQRTITIWSSGLSVWMVKTSGSPTVEAD